MLDEPTANLDIENELSLKEAVLSAFKEHLVIIATHRYHWLDDVDQAIVLSHGTAEEMGGAR